MRAQRLIWLLILCSSAQAEIYTESGYRSSKQQAFQSARVRVPIVKRFGLFAGSGLEWATLGQGENAFDSGSSFFYLEPGYRIEVASFQLIGALRIRHPFLNSPRFSSIDARITLTGGREYRLEQLFLESYGELVYTSADTHNIVVTGIARKGVQLNSSFDIHIQSKLLVDRLGHYYYRNYELGIGGRYQLKNMQLHARWGWKFYFPNNGENNPYRNSRQGAELLLVLGGAL